MEIIYIQEEEIDAVKAIIPEGVLSGVVFVLAAVDNEEIKGVAVIQSLSEKHVALKWLYVLEKYRENGVGKAILDFICEEIQAEEDTYLTFEYPGEEQYTNVLNHMFLAKGGELESSVIRIGSIGRNGLLNAPIRKLEVPEEYSNGSLYAISEVPVERLKDFSLNIEDIRSADKLLSVVYAIDKNIAGYLLIEADEKSGEYIISGFGMKPEFISHTQDFLRLAYGYLIEVDDGIKKLSFVIYEDRIFEFAGKLLGEGMVCEEQQIVRGYIHE